MYAQNGQHDMFKSVKKRRNDVGLVHLPTVWTQVIHAQS